MKPRRGFLDNFNRGKLIGESRAEPSRGVSHCVLEGSFALRAQGEFRCAQGEKWQSVRTAGLGRNGEVTPKTRMPQVCGLIGCRQLISS